MRKEATDLERKNLAFAKRKWAGELGRPNLEVLKSLSQQYGFSIAGGDLLLLEGKWYVTHAGLVRLSHHARCFGIRVQPVREFCNPAIGRWVFKATVYKSPGSRGFVGYGDADPSNVSSLVHGAEMRVAETRAVNRALRKAYGIGLCSVEEIGSFRPPFVPSREKQTPQSASGNGSGNGQPRLRDRLCLSSVRRAV